MINVSSGCVSSSVNVFRDTMNIYQGGSAINTNVNSVGTLNVSSSGVANGVTVNRDGFVFVYSGGTAMAIKENGGAVIVSSGASVSFVENSFGDFRLSSSNARRVTVHSGTTAIHIGIMDNTGYLDIYGGICRQCSAYGFGAITVYSGTAEDCIISGRGYLFIKEGGKADHTTLRGEENYSAYLMVSKDAITENTTINDYSTMTISQGVGINVVLSGYSALLSVNGGYAYDIRMQSGSIVVASGGIAENICMNSGNLTLSSGTTASLVYNPWQSGTINSNTGATLITLAPEAKIYYGMTGSGLMETFDETLGLEVGYRCSALVYSGAVANDTIVNGSRSTADGVLRIMSGGVANRTTVDKSGLCYISNGGFANSIRLCDNAGLYMSGAANDVVVEKGFVRIYSGGELKSINIQSGSMYVSRGGKITGLMTIGSGAVVSAYTGSIIDFDISDATPGDTALMNNLSLIKGTPGYAMTVSETSVLGEYSLAEGADGFAQSITVASETGDEIGALSLGKVLVGAGRPVKYGLSLTDGALSLEIGKFDEVSSALALNINGETVNTDGRAARWTGDTAVGSGTINVVSADFGGDAWLDIDGADLSGNVLYGAAGDFSGVVNIHAGAGKLRNVAAGAQAGGSVGGVDLTLGGAEVSGAVYAGGFGSVTGAVNTAISGGTFAKDVFAGALANKNSAKTSVGDVTLSVTNGTFAGNLYGAAAVRTAATVGNGLRHTAGEVSVTLAGGSAERPDFCCFAGGYATGNATGSVYTVESVTAELSGGAWGEARGGRGIYGGIFASQVEAKVAGDVNITISGGAMGNVYGGGWAQKNGTSCVAGDVNITVTGGSLGSIYGGGSHSTSVGSEGSATVVGGDIYITLAGGDISGGVYTRGQLGGDSVEGSAYVTVTGNVDYRCGIYGYSYDGSEGDARLEFADYTGGFSGALGGFSEVALSGATVTEFSGAVSNQSWLFDLADRAETLAGTAFLTWDDADFSTGTVKLRLDGEQAPECAWDLVRVAGATAFREFDVLVGDDSILADTLALDEAISGGFADGWGFTIEDSVLKFKQLA